MKPIDGAMNQVTDARVAAAKGESEVVEAARQLEAVFVGMLFDEMAKTIEKEDALFGESPGAEMYEGWFRHEIANQWAASGGTGLGDAIAGSIAARDPGALASSAPVSAKPTAAVNNTGVRAGLPPLPVAGRISSDFGHRVHPVSQKEHFHAGVDIAAPVGTPIEAPYAGRVVKVSDEGPMGNHVVVEHPNGFRSVYAHASEIQVSEGQTIRAGERLGLTGASGRATGPHLHFTLLKDGKPVDPLRWLSPRGGVSVR